MASPRRSWLSRALERGGSRADDPPRAGGQALALVSDAGTPLVSDPGYKLVQAAIAEGLPVTPIPGLQPSRPPSWSPAADGSVLLEGFLPPRSAARRTRLARLAGIPGTLMVFEAPHRLPEMLVDAAAVLGERRRWWPANSPRCSRRAPRDPAPAGRTVRRRRASEGEIVVLIGEATQEMHVAETDAVLDERLEAALEKHSIKDAAAIVASELDLPKRDVYARALALAKAKG
jgi:16S rRNA (cytidine1402-2'-O)-methyltransferase